MSKSRKIERSPDPELFSGVKTLIEQSRQAVAVAVNSTMTMLYWEVGRRINAEVLNDQRAEYGKQVVAALSEQLSAEYGKGWSTKHLRHCLRFSEVFTEKAIVSTLWRQLSWSQEISDEITSPGLIGGMVVVGADDGTVSAFGAGE